MSSGPGLRQRLRRPLMVAVPILLLVGAAAEYQANERYASTDNAFIRATKGSINARVSGQVVEIAVRDNQFVRKGQLLFRIDPEPYEIAVEEAEARLGNARIQINALKATYRQQLAELQSARDSGEFDAQEFDRKKNLLASDFTSRSAYERSETDYKVGRQHVASAEQQVSTTVAALNGNPNIAVDQHPTVREAKAQLDRANLDLAYTRILAPDDGIVTKVDDLQLGDFVHSGAAIFAMMSARHMWVEANFRETQLTHMRPGQRATIAVDAYPGHSFKAHVVSMSPGTGSQFALLPPENATGNWVKVVQRLPIRLELDAIDPRWPLYSGISVTARIDTDAPVSGTAL
ncbi:HlyD family secretion protein [Rhizorhabdus argentea]|uniref:HlyD family secretion protein n=1 Tax=Rhizorhabdus argentea TaxID=1387174 RepID=UPI0030EE39EF